MNYSVHIFTNSVTHEFSVSCRADDNNDFDEIADMEAARGFESSTIVRNIPKYDADTMKAAIIRVMEVINHKRVTREAISVYRARTGGRAPKRVR